MEAFSPQFKVIIDTDLAQAILIFLKEEKTIVMMETAIAVALYKIFDAHIEATDDDSKHSYHLSRTHKTKIIHTRHI